MGRLRRLSRRAVRGARARPAGRVERRSWSLVVGFALIPPLLSHDVYSYVDYARLGALHGIDPYVHGPAAAPADPAFAARHLAPPPSAYGPLFTLASYPLAWLAPSSAVWVLKGTPGFRCSGLQRSARGWHRCAASTLCARQPSPPSTHWS